MKALNLSKLCLVLFLFALSQAAYCARNRELAKDPERPFYSIAANKFSLLEKNTFVANMSNSVKPAPSLRLSLSIYEFGILRCSIEELKPFRKRFKISQFGPVTIDSSAKKLALTVKVDRNTLIISTKESTNESRLSGLRGKFKKTPERHSYLVELELSPFKLKYLVDGKVQAMVNDEQLLNYEEYRSMEQQYNTQREGTYHDATKYEANVANLYFDGFGGKNYSVPYGPSSVGLDFKFPESRNLYGLPFHTTSYKLESTVDTPEPYRFFHSDVYGYEAKSKMAIYGSIPYILSESTETYTEMLWLNGADTWIDIWDKTAHWFSEAGTIEFFLFSGSTPERILAKVHLISGKAPMPLYAALGYHQSRYTYNDEKDVFDVDKGFDSRVIPYDSMWLDIEHTFGRRYFTWNRQKFPNPVPMQNHFADKSRFMVAIVDPHIAKDNDYFVYKGGLERSKADKSIFIRDVNKEVFYGTCWPGSSAYIDFLNAEARDFWARQLIAHPEATENLFIWNDMNEPSVFESPEMTLPKNCLHSTASGEIYEHREVHNVYGILTQMSTFDALVRKNPNTRPFVLARAFYLGSQRYGAIWTGDNVANWDHLGVSLTMVMSVAMGGFSFLGADIGGYKGNPSEELLVRWYQFGIFYPFFRGHSDMVSMRREPWLFSTETNNRIREAIHMRYKLLPYMYTSFYEHSIYGTPMWRPVFYSYPDAPSEIVDKQVMVGPDIMVIPVLEPTDSMQVYLPPESMWYSYYNYKESAKGKIGIDVSMDQIGIYVRGGAVIPKFGRIRRSSKLMRLVDPYTFTVFLDEEGKAEGYLYLDDGESWDYEKKKAYLLKEISFNEKKLTIKNAHKGWECKNEVERIEIVGYKGEIQSVLVGEMGSSVQKKARFVVNKEGVIEIQKANIDISKEYVIKLLP